MKIQKVLPLLLCIVIGIAMSELMFRQYDTVPTEPTLKETTSEDLFFAQIGVYSSEQNMRNNLKEIENYIFEQKDTKYYAYVGIAKTEKSINKIKGYYKENGYNIYVKEKTVTNASFLEVLDQYEKLLDKTNDSRSIETIASQVVSKYEELVKSD